MNHCKILGVFFALTLSFCSLAIAGQQAEKIISVEQAKDTAVKMVPDGKFVAIEKDFEKEYGLIYEVLVIDATYKYEFDIDAKTGIVLGFQKDPIYQLMGQKANASADIEKAKAIALKATAGGDIIEFEEEIEHGVKVFKIDIINQDYTHEIVVDAANGEIIKQESERLAGVE